MGEAVVQARPSGTRYDENIETANKGCRFQKDILWPFFLYLRAMMRFRERLVGLDYETLLSYAAELSATHRHDADALLAKHSPLPASGVGTRQRAALCRLAAGARTLSPRCPET